MKTMKANTVAGYLKQLPAERRAVVSKVRAVIRKHLPKGYKEMPGWGMITYAVPLSRYPDTYNDQPLCYAALAAQKHHYAVYLMCVNGDKARETRLRQAFKAAGKKLDMGKSCIRFKRLEDLPLEIIGGVIASMSLDEFIARYEKFKPRRAG